MYTISPAAVLKEQAHIVLTHGEEWPLLLRPTVNGIELPAFCKFIIGGHESHRYGNRVLTVESNGSMIAKGIEAALQIADANGLHAMVANSVYHLSTLARPESPRRFFSEPTC